MKKFGRFLMAFAAIGLVLTGCNSKGSSSSKQTPGERVDAAIAYVKSEFSAKKIATDGVSKDFDLYDSYNGVAISYVSDKTETISISADNKTATVNPSSEGDVFVTLTATFKYQKVSKDQNFGVKVLKNIPENTIAELQASAPGTFTVRGVVLATSIANTSKEKPQFNAYIQHPEAGGLYLYGISADYANDFAVGNMVRVTGSVVLYSGLYELNAYQTGFSYDVLSTGNPLPAYENITDNIAEKTASTLTQATMLEIDDFVISETVATPGTDSFYSFKSYTVYGMVGSTKVQLRMKSEIASAVALHETVQALEVGDILNIKGYGDWYNGFQIVPAAIENKGKHTFTDAEYVDLAMSSFKFTTTTVAADFTLPLTANHDVVVSWESDNAAIVVDGANATVTRGTDDVVVNLTATFTLNEASANKSYEVTVLKQVQGDQAASTKYSFASLKGTGSTLNATGVKAAMASGVASGSDYLTDVTTASRVYDGNGTGGFYPNTSGLLKFGTSSANGELTLVFASKVTKVVINCHSWTASSNDTLSINGETAQNVPSGDTAEDLTFELATASENVAIVAVKRMFVFSIEVYFEA